MGNKIIELTSALTTRSKEIIPDIFLMKFTVVNACLVGYPNRRTDNWVLVDTGLENSADAILKYVEKRFGKGSRPKAIILTHGHFDHVGSVIKLSHIWNIPVYIHESELPYITGQKDYPLANPNVDEGIVAKMSTTFPHTSIDIGPYAKVLPQDNSVPFMPDWKWIHTPGHTEGHISLWRQKDRVLIAGDAISTTKQESLMSVLTQHEHISGPPKYLTENWNKAENSVRHIRNLKPALLIPSHGKIMAGEELSKHLDLLVNKFDKIAKPKK